MTFFNRQVSKIFGKDILDILNHSKNYFFGAAFAQGLLFLAMPLLTLILTPADYGIYQVFRSYADIFIILLTLNFHGAVSRYYYDSQPDLNEFIGTSIISSNIILSVAALLLLIFPIHIANFLTIPAPIIWVLLALTFVKVFESIFNQLSIASKNSLQYSMTNNARAVLALGAGIIFALALRENKYYGMIFGQMLGSVAVGFYIFLLIKNNIKWRINKAHLWFIISYSLPLVPYVVSTMFLDKLDRILINKIINASSAGLYSFAYNIGMIISAVTDSLNSAFIPDWFRLMREEKYGELNILTLKTFRLTLLAAVFAILFSQEAFALISSAEYHEALLILPIVISGYVFDFLSKVYLRNLGLAKKMTHAALLGMFTVLLNFTLNIVFLPIYGYVAAAYATLASYIFLTFFAWVTAKYILKHAVVPWRIFAGPFLYFTLALVASYLIMDLNFSLFSTLALKAFVMTLFGLAMMWNAKYFKTKNH